jgi:16S rRNA U516 pseudouridylate synthase RsuA-like enzyme
MWAQSVLHPSAGLTKEYVVTCSEEPTRRQLETIAAGCEVDGAFVTPVAVAPVKESGQKNRLRVVISEGRNREVQSSAMQSAQPPDWFGLLGRCSSSSCTLRAQQPNR